MNEVLKDIIPDISSFKELIEKECLYIDKTMYFHRLVSSKSKYFFLSRPRRFGKSLTVSALESIFLGEKELFKGLYIEDKWNFDEYPVLHFDMSDLNGKTLSENSDKLLRRLRIYAYMYKIDEYLLGNASTPGVIFSNLIESIHMKTGKQVVVLIDEYDNPLLEHIEGESFEQYREMLESFYSCLKPRGKDLRFCFITGITRFSQVSIFSKLNNLVDLSDDPDYAAICGYTDEEIDKYFTPYFEKYFEESGLTSDEKKTEFRNRVREYYDGYRFTLDSDVTLYNPVSIGKFASAKCRKFDNYWIGTGSQTIVKELIKAHVELFKNKREFKVSDSDSMKTFEAKEFFEGQPDSDGVYSFLKQAGYLSLDRSDVAGRIYLRYPNLEVAATMGKDILKAMGMESASAESLISIGTALKDEDTNRLIETLEKCLEKYPYDLTLEKEKGFQIVLYTLFSSIIDDVRVEEHTPTGRMDLLIPVRDRLYYILELKVNRSAKVALTQIEEMGYYKRLMKSGNTIHLVGINFSKKKRNIQGWDEKVISF